MHDTWLHPATSLRAHMAARVLTYFSGSFSMAASISPRQEPRPATAAQHLDREAPVAHTPLSAKALNESMHSWVGPAVLGPGPSVHCFRTPALQPGGAGARVRRQGGHDRTAQQSKQCKGPPLRLPGARARKALGCPQAACQGAPSLLTAT